jgi:hypothetical protein
LNIGLDRQRLAAGSSNLFYNRVGSDGVFVIN